MRDLNYTIRLMTATDIPALIDFYNALEAVEPTDASYSVAEYTRAYNEAINRNASTRYVARLINPDGSEGKLFGYGMVHKADNDRTAWSRLNVLPEYRGRGLGMAIYQQLRETVREKWATEWRVALHQSWQLAIEFWERRGFVIDRYSWDMRLAADVAVPAAQLPDGFTLRNHVPEQDDETLWQVSNESFAQHPWFHPSTLEERVYGTQQPGFQPSNILYACNAEGAVAGYCWTSTSEEEMQRRNLLVGWVQELGVIPAYQGRGLGRALLLSGIRYLRQSVEEIELAVEGLNAKALLLYESVGFRICNGQVNMERKLDWSKDER